MHSSRMRTVHSSSCLSHGGLPQCMLGYHPRKQTPLGADPQSRPPRPGTHPLDQPPHPTKQTPLDQAPPQTRHTPRTGTPPSRKNRPPRPGPPDQAHSPRPGTPSPWSRPPGPGTHPPTRHTPPGTPLPVDRMTDTCKNITFATPQRRLDLPSVLTTDCLDENVVRIYKLAPNCSLDVSPSNWTFQWRTLIFSMIWVAQI